MLDASFSYLVWHSWPAVWLKIKSVLAVFLAQVSEQSYLSVRWVRAHVWRQPLCQRECNWKEADSCCLLADKYSSVLPSNLAAHFRRSDFSTVPLRKARSTRNFMIFPKRPVSTDFTCYSYHLQYVITVPWSARWVAALFWVCNRDVQHWSIRSHDITFFFCGETPKIIFHIARNPCIRKRK